MVMLTKGCTAPGPDLTNINLTYGALITQSDMRVINPSSDNFFVYGEAHFRRAFYSTPTNVPDACGILVPHLVTTPTGSCKTAPFYGG